MDRKPSINGMVRQVLWKYIKGEHSTVPVPRRSAFVTVSKEKGRISWKLDWDAGR